MYCYNSTELTKQDGKLTCKPIKSRIVSLQAEQNDLMCAVPGGLIGVGTKIDPTLCRADRMVGQVLGSVGGLPDIFTELEVSYYLLRRLLGVRTEGDKKGAKGSVRQSDFKFSPTANQSVFPIFNYNFLLTWNQQ